MLLRPDVFRHLCRARDLLCEVGEGQASVGEVARAVGISQYHFIRQFEAVFGATPHQLRIHARLGRARRLLAAGHMPVTEVCLEVGFSSLGSFSALFRRRVGVTPSAYQRRLRGLVQVPPSRPVSPVAGCLTLMGGLPPGTFRNFREA
ncbi:helix-turn-helix transcriptional regulator [Nannocystis bainbridge]|uniref:AraC family transcriptional regulator n=1 Tax=Nannocystis bainbridge TaxID=2995303 RepID=A0ABT5EDL0_9BACT|nr:AraC family transcriptional regulator [Nannocystis bainbridge]MDC0723485.1 AraC family transcriptional regulator [Nannocystis bainbridge]